MFWILFVGLVWANELTLFPSSDTIHIVQNPLLETGFYPSLDLFKDTHTSYLLFDLAELHQSNLINPIQAKIQFFVIWAEKNESPVYIEQAFVNKAKWTENTILRVDIDGSSHGGPCLPLNNDGTSEFCLHHQRVDRIGHVLDSTYATSHSTVEFDVSDVVQTAIKQNINCNCKLHDSISELLDKCRQCQENAQFITFKLSTNRNFWIKVSSKDSVSSHTHPKLIISSAPLHDFLHVTADAGVIKQNPALSNINHSTLDIVSESHVAFLQFNANSLFLSKLKDHLKTPVDLFVINPSSLSRDCDCSRSENDPSCSHIPRSSWFNDVLCWWKSLKFSTGSHPSVKLRLYTHWSEHHGTLVRASFVKLPVEVANDKFCWNNASNYYSIASPSHFVYTFSHSFVDIDVTDMIENYFKLDYEVKLDGEEIERSDVLQFRLFTDSFSWVKFASQQYPIVSNRPQLILTTVSTLDVLFEYIWLFHYIYMFIVRPMQSTLVAILLVYGFFVVKRLCCKSSKVYST